MLAPVEGVELLIALEAVNRIIVLDPLLLGAEGGLDYFLHLLVHQSTNIATLGWMEYIRFPYGSAQVQPLLHPRPTRTHHR